MIGRSGVYAGLFTFSFVAWQIMLRYLDYYVGAYVGGKCDKHWQPRKLVCLIDTKIIGCLITAK